MNESKIAKILIVEDHDSLRQLLIEIVLEIHGVVVVGAAANGEQSLIEYRKTQPDLVLMDLSMPKVNGVDATRSILAEFPSARIIAMSASASTQEITKAFVSGARAYVQKDKIQEHLNLMIPEILSGKVLIPSNIAKSIFRLNADAPR